MRLQNTQCVERVLVAIISYLYFYDKKSGMFEHDENSGFRAAMSASKDS